MADFFCVNITAVHFLAFNCICHESAHFSNVFRSDWRAAKLLIVQYTTQSSSKSLMDELMLTFMSFMNIWGQELFLE